MSTKNKASLARQAARGMMEMRNAIRWYLQEKIRDHQLDISFELLEVLGFLYINNAVPQQVIADKMVKDKSSMTYLVNSLVKKSLVTRKADTNDGRNKLICLTKKGTGILETINPWVQEIYSKAVAGIPLKDIETAVLFINKMNNNLTCENENHAYTG